MKNHYRSRLAVSVGALTASLILAGAAHAQVSTSSIRGSAPAGATVMARNVETGFTSVDTAAADGDYRLPGLKPGTYAVSVTVNGETTTRTVRVLVGQTARIDLADDVATVEEVVVTALPAAHVTTSEVATSLTREQIDRLPQQNRNFINFAALAPGVRVSQDDKEVTFAAGGQNPLAVNVFIDGQNQKGNIIDGGFTGQDDSRGNPFPQLAIQEFRVVTQNFKAEYEQSSSAIITAVTRSGGNEFHGEVFGTYQDENWITLDEFSKKRSGEKPSLTRKQFGFAVGGPIIEDKLHYFGTYEAKREDRVGAVTLGRSGPPYDALFGQYEQTVPQPFEEDLYFGKLSFQPNTAHRFDLSVSYRTEQDIRDAVGRDAAERANSVSIDETKANLRHQWTGRGWLNEAQVDYLKSTYNPVALNFTDFGREYVIFRDADSSTPAFDFNPWSREATVIHLGGRGTRQFIEQSSLTFKDDLTFTDLQWHGDHVVKLGVKLAKHNYVVQKDLDRNPDFLFDAEANPAIFGSRDIPIMVRIGSPAPSADVDNTVFGLYVQDDWQITDKLELNLGLRWDYEDNAYNNDYQTPANIKALLAAYEAKPGYDLPFKAADYISNGDRESFKGAFQPRIGFSYDVFGDERTVIFGGAGRYYDRVPYNFAFDERFKPTQWVKEIFFSPGGAIPGTVAWDPSYLTAAGLQPLLDAAPNQGEVFLIKNKAEPPRTDQFNLGLRQQLGQFRTALTLSYAKTENGFGWNIGNLGTGPDPRWNGPTPSSLGFTEFRNIVFISNHDQEREYKALYLTVDKPYTEASRWGMTFAYTLSEAKQNGSRDANTAPFEFDYARTADTPWFYAPTDERHRIVATGIVGLPWDMTLSGMLTLGSGTPFNVWTPTGPRWNEGRPAKDDFLFLKDVFATQQLDFRLSKAFDVWSGDKVEVTLDAINILDHKNYTDFEGWILAPNFGQPRQQLYPTRSFQVGLRYKW